MGILLDGGHVPPGFEVVIADKEVCPGSKGGIWNLWWNVQLNDDLRAWDEEVKALNELQSKLELTTDQRLIRAQMAEFCRESPSFPESVEVLCREVGAGRFSEPLRMGCGGRKLLDSLGYPGTPDQEKRVLRGYARSIEMWLEVKEPSSPLDFKINGFLGPHSEKKRGLMRELIDLLKNTDTGELMEWSKDNCVQGMGESVFDWKGRPFKCFGCPGARPEEGSPHLHVLLGDDHGRSPRLPEGAQGPRCRPTGAQEVQGGVRSRSRLLHKLLVGGIALDARHVDDRDEVRP